MTLKAGSVNSFANSMAEAMEQVFKSEWASHKDLALGDAGELDRKILFSAISQGVVNYLRDNINDALTVEVSTTQESSNNINSGNGTVSVTQNSGAGNRVESSGASTVIELSTE